MSYRTASGPRQKSPSSRKWARSTYTPYRLISSSTTWPSWDSDSWSFSVSLSLSLAWTFSLFLSSRHAGLEIPWWAREAKSLVSSDHSTSPWIVLYTVFCNMLYKICFIFLLDGWKSFVTSAFCFTISLLPCQLGIFLCCLMLAAILRSRLASTFREESETCINYTLLLLRWMGKRGRRLQSARNNGKVEYYYDYYPLLRSKTGKMSGKCASKGLLRNETAQEFSSCMCV